LINYYIHTPQALLSVSASGPIPQVEQDSNLPTDTAKPARSGRLGVNLTKFYETIVPVSIVLRKICQIHKAFVRHSFFMEIIVLN
jgi:hypothetical protein